MARLSRSRPSAKASSRRVDRQPVRYAVVGLGHIAQVAVLPAFAHARRNSVLTALVSDDPAKLEALGRKHRVKGTYSYEDYEQCLAEVDAVFITLPNSMHAEYTVRAARRGVHVLCEKPMAVRVGECKRMIRACDVAGVKLMIAYRLHFEPLNLAAVVAARRGQLGALKYFTSAFSMRVREGNIRTEPALGGGTLYDIGVYCINAARNLFVRQQRRGCDPGHRRIHRRDSAIRRRSHRDVRHQLQRSCRCLLSYCRDKGAHHAGPVVRVRRTAGRDRDHRRAYDQDARLEARSVRR
jgi:predicted dehydrogenase